MDFHEAKQIIAEFKTYLQWAKTVGVQTISSDTKVSKKEHPPSISANTTSTSNPSKTFDSLEPETLYQIVSQCRDCQFSQNRVLPLFGFGNPQAKLVILIDVPYEVEQPSQSPINIEQRDLLEKMLQSIELAWHETYLMALTKCPSSVDHENDFSTKTLAIDACKKHLKAHIEYITPLVILVFGQTASQSILSTTLSIDTLRGRWWNFQGIAVMPTLNITEIFESQQNKKEAWSDLKAVKKILNLRTS